MDFTLNFALHETVASWARQANLHRFLVSVPAGVVVILAAALVGRWLAVWSPVLGFALGLVAAAAGIAWGCWRLWTSRWTVGAVAARVDRRARHHDLVQTGLAVEAGTAVGDAVFQKRVLLEARTAVPACAPLAVAKERVPPRAWAAAAALVGAHLAVGGVGGSTPGETARPVPSREGVPWVATARDGVSPASREPGEASGPVLEDRDQQQAPRGAPTAGASRGRDASGSAMGTSVAAVAETAALEDGAGMDPMAAATDIWVPGAGGGGEGGAMDGRGAKTGQERAGSAGVRDGDLAAPETNEREQAAGGGAPAGADASEAVEDLKTVEGSTDEGGGTEDAEAGGDSSLAPEATGEDTEETLTSRNQPGSGELGKGRDEEMEGESGAGSTGQGGANAASGSAQAIAESTPPDWEVAAEWVEARWRQAPTGQLKAVSEGQTGRRSSVEFQQIASQYEALAEGDARPDVVPPGRRAYLTHYFDLLREPASPPGDPDGDD